ncbi:MAG TPA: serine hydrolase [Bryobacteraceae bacterium]|nr:serine hydrolase [Bryobacteraceae bacterium]
MALRRAVCIGLSLLAMCLISGGQSSTYWPSPQWRTATPESQGIDSQTLADVIDQVTEKHLGVHSLLVIRHGYAVVDANFYPYDGRTPHDLASVTKTVTSVLTGVAVAQKLIRLDQALLPLFPRESPAKADAQKQKITLGDLLRMESGLDCGYTPGEPELEQMKRSPNWVQFALSLPMKYDPGTHSAYCSPGYHLLGSAIGAAAGMREADFGSKYLFEPLGIHGVVWADDPQSRSHGWGDSHFFPQDVAKIGYLYLHGGTWNGREIVPADWVAMSTARPTGERGGHGAMGYEWNATDGPNGRQYGGTGRGGQSLIVWPDLDMIVVSMAGGNAGHLGQLVRQAVKSDQALPPNPLAYAHLEERVADAAKPPAAGASSPLPPMAFSISGATYEFAVNTSRIDSLSLKFEKNGDARVDLAYYGQPLSFPIGLNGVYRVGPNGPFQMPAGAMGKWIGENEFLLDVNFIANINHYTLDIRFEGDQIEVTANEASGLIRNGRLIGKRRL